ncbi:hypothetical protein [Okeania hirsuta]|nr:hypothetical protein [Okeania hirsuta]
MASDIELLLMTIAIVLGPVKPLVSTSMVATQTVWGIFCSKVTS